MIERAELEVKQRPDRCETCKWWERDVPRGGAKGECRVKSPTLTPNADGGYSSDNVIWPRTWNDDFCGEWRPA